MWEPVTPVILIYNYSIDKLCPKTLTHLSEAQTRGRQNSRLSCLVTKNKWGRNKETIIPVWQPPPLLFVKRSTFLSLLENIELHPTPSVSCHPLNHNTISIRFPWKTFIFVTRWPSADWRVGRYFTEGRAGQMSEAFPHPCIWMLLKINREMAGSGSTELHPEWIFSLSHF